MIEQGREERIDTVVAREHERPRRIRLDAPISRSERVDEWRSSGLDVYAYFNNDKLACGVRDAEVLRRQVLGKK